MSETNPKQKIRKVLESLCGSRIDEFIADLEAKKASYEREGYSDLEVDMDYCDSYEGQKRMVLVGTRHETDEEYAKRMAREREQEAFQRQQYEALKAKFEGGK